MTLGLFIAGADDYVNAVAIPLPRGIFNMFYALVIVASLSRMVPHPPNVACIAAAGLFAGCYLRGWRSVAVPLAAMFIGDLAGQVFAIGGLAFYSPSLMAVVYGSIAISVWIGRGLRDHRSVPRLATASLAMSTVFFVLTNAAVFASGMYGLTLAGFAKCFAAAMPFFQYTVVGDLAFVALMFGVYECTLWIADRRRETGRLKTLTPCPVNVRSHDNNR